MRIGVTLATLRNEVKLEAGISTGSSHSVMNDERLNHLINRTERLAYKMDDWPSLAFEEEVAVIADAQFVTLPTNMTFAMINEVWVAYGSEWLPVTHGIGMAERSMYSDTQRASPIMRWEIRAPGNVDFEVWPRSSSAETLRFVGQKVLGAMSDDTDTCVIDADVLVLRVASELLAKDEKADAGIKLKAAQSLTEKLLKRLGAAKRGSFSMSGERKKALRPGIDYIPSGGS